MPVDNSRPHGNHFSADTRQACGAAGNRTIDSSRPNPGTTDTFMKAAQPQQTARQAQRSFASNSFHPGDVRPGGTSRACACSNNRHGTSSSLYTSMHDDLINDPCHSDSTKPKKSKVVCLVVGLVILAVVAFGGTTGFFLYKDAKSLQAQAGTLMSEVSFMKDHLKNGEGEQLNATAGTVAEQIASMRDTVDGPAWTIASFIPVYGDDIKLVRGMMEQADILAQDAMLPACAQLEDFKLGNLLTDGAVNIEMLKGLITTIQDVEPVVVSSIDAIDALPEPHIGKIKSLMDKVTGPMASAKTVLSNINEIAPVLPQMLGDGGSRTYLLMAQQNAELRATGGLPGSIGPLIVENGKITVGEFVAGSTNFSTEANMHGDVTAEENALFSDLSLIHI